jgi:UDP-N-acetyl-D-mannosaminuronate dehydrogenase
LDEKVRFELPIPHTVDAVIFAVAHERYRNLDVKEWLKESTPAIVDGSNVLSKKQRDVLRAAGCKVATIGRGDGL